MAKKNCCPKLKRMPKSKILEKITHAAVKDINGNIYKGKSHADCYEKGFKLNAKMTNIQGFVTNKREFVNRAVAAKIANKSGQIDCKTTMLFSEHLWWDVYNGKHDYPVNNKIQPIKEKKNHSFFCVLLHVAPITKKPTFF